MNQIIRLDLHMHAFVISAASCSLIRFNDFFYTVEKGRNAFPVTRLALVQVGWHENSSTCVFFKKRCDKLFYGECGLRTFDF